MLGLPVITGQHGFIPFTILLIFSWLVMTTTALLFTEVLAPEEPTTNFVSLAETFSGKKLKLVTFFVYALLFLSLTFGYVKGGGIFISEILPIKIESGVLFFLMLFAPLMAFNYSIVGRFNSVFVVILFTSFFVLVFLGLQNVTFQKLTTASWKGSMRMVPLLVTSFGFHSILPSLNQYLNDRKQLRVAIVLGTTTTLIIYILWNLLVLGIVPQEELERALWADQTAVTPLKKFLNAYTLEICSQLFCFSALITSFWGVGMGLVDFFLDTFSIKKGFSSKVVICLLTYVTAFFVAQTKSSIFYLSFEYGSGPACFYLLIFLPIFFFFRVSTQSRKFFK